MTRLSPEEVTDLVEVLAAIEHERWAHWQSYLHSQGKKEPDGSLSFSRDQIGQWERQVATPYSMLSDREKESDREQVWRYLSPLLDLFEISVDGKGRES